MDTVAGDKSGDTKVLQSTISRFACRIIADRNDVNNCRIYAAGFDSSRNIFLGVSDPQFYRKTCWTQIVLYKMPNTWFATVSGCFAKNPKTAKHFLLRFHQYQSGGS